MTLGHRDIGVLGLLDTGTLEHQDTKTHGHQDTGTMSGILVSTYRNRVVIIFRLSGEYFLVLGMTHEAG